ncbi:MAG: ROK family protein, partial [Novosphingobium sp.]
LAVARDPARDPFPGRCTYHGDCLEGLASGPAIEDRWGTSLSKLASPADRIALIADYLGQLAANLVLLHMPDRLVFGGGVMKTPGLIEALRLSTERRLAGYVQAAQLDPGLERYIVTPGLGDEAGITGAVLLGRQALA